MSASERPVGHFPMLKPQPDAARISLEHPLELHDAPDFVSWPPQVSLQTMVELSEQALRDRAAAGWPIHYSTPVPVEFSF